MLFVSLVQGGCSSDRGVFDDSFSGIPVVDAVLLVGRPLPDIFLHQTQRAGVAYTDSTAGLSNAQVVISWDGGSLDFFEHPTEEGRYEPPSIGPTVQPSTEYRLQVTLEDGRRVNAETVTPPTFDVTDWVLLDEETLDVTRTFRTFEDAGDSVFTAPENQVVYLTGLLEARFQDAGRTGRYQVGISSLDLDSPFVIDADFLEPEDYEDFERDVGSPALEASDGFVRLPWFAIFFAGRHKIRVYSVDENWFDLVRSSPEINGPAGPNVGGTAGDNFERPIFHVDGGIGLFGSACVDSIGFVILPRS